MSEIELFNHNGITAISYDDHEKALAEQRAEIDAKNKTIAGQEESIKEMHVEIEAARNALFAQGIEIGDLKSCVRSKESLLDRSAAANERLRREIDTKEKWELEYEVQLSDKDKIIYAQKLKMDELEKICDQDRTLSALKGMYEDYKALEEKYNYLREARK